MRMGVERREDPEEKDDWPRDEIRIEGRPRASVGREGDGEEGEVGGEGGGDEGVC